MFNKIQLPNKLSYLLVIIVFWLCSGNVCAATSMDFEEKAIHETNEKLHMRVDVIFPYFTTNYLSEVNDVIKKHVDLIIGDFKNNLANQAAVTHKIEGLPLNTDSNALNVSYRIMLATPHFISIRFEIYTFFYGAAHPNTNFESINYNVKASRVFNLTDIFKQNSHYLVVIARYAKQHLAQQLTKAAQEPGNEKVEPFPEGIKPILKNYKVWNLTDQGLLITFPAYQVAAYVFGPQEVLIPYVTLKYILNEYPPVIGMLNQY